MTEELSPSEAAKRIGTSTRTVQRWIETGRLRARRVGGRWRVASDAIGAFVADGAPRGADRVAPPAPTGEPVRILFIANRGEIAARIGRTCARIGVRAVAAQTEGPAAVDLLDVDAVVAAARAAGADAVHPGFGFLAENATFAEAVAAAGMRWVGPIPDAIRTMGDKAAARRLAASLGVPVLPGYDAPDQSDQALLIAADRTGFPILVKPSAGGGGKGMRTVRDPARLPDALAAARREAGAAFGDGRLILERMVEGARHVEVQVLFDRHGSGVDLGERDCSIQRRHQKVLEETPSPAVDPALRARLADAALALGQAVGYESAGTCEFLIDDRGEATFLEMNTRLQVEHPVTELVTGRDLVEDQLRIAAGAALADLGLVAPVRSVGHAVEVRLYAEDAEDGFLPATGRVEALRWPAGDGIRVDAGIELGTDIGGRFDPMLAKICAWGADRIEAFERLAAALDDTVVLGVVTNLRFLRWLVREPVLLDGQARTDTLERIWPPDDWAERTRVPDEAWAIAADALTAREEPPDAWAGGWRLNGPASVRVATDTGTKTVTMAPGPDRCAAVRTVDHVRTGHTAYLDLAGRSVGFRLAPPPDIETAARAAGTHGRPGSSGPADLVAPMPGAVLHVHAAVGATVAAGDPVVTLEAMKMEHVVAASVDGRVAELRVRPSEQVTRGQVLAIIEP